MCLQQVLDLLGFVSRNLPGLLPGPITSYRDQKDNAMAQTATAHVMCRAPGAQSRAAAAAARRGSPNERSMKLGKHNKQLRPIATN